MKKLLAIILVVLMSVSVMLFTACNKDQGDASSSSAPGRQSSSEEESSTRRRGDGASSSSIGGNSTSNGSSTEDNSSSLENGNSSQENPNTSSSAQNPTNSSSQGDGTSSSYQPSSGSNVYGTYPYSYSTSVKDVAFDINLEYTFVDNYILSLEKPSLNGTFYDALVDAEDAYNALSASDKGMVANYSRLVEARTAYDDMASQEATSLINQMSEPSLDNLTEFANQKTKIQFLLDRMSSTSGITNLSNYNQKVSSLQSVVVDAFKNDVSAISTFEDSDAYKVKLDKANETYLIVVDTGFASLVTNEKKTLDDMMIKWNTREVVGNFSDLLQDLPGADNLQDTDKATVRALKNAYSSMSATEKANISSSDLALYNEYVAKAQTLWPEHLLYTTNANRGGDDFFKTEKVSDRKASNLGETSNGKNCPCLFNGETLTDACKMKTGERQISFKIESPSNFTVVANLQSKHDPSTLTLWYNGSEVAKFNVSYQQPENTSYSTFLLNAGEYILTSESSEMLIFALYVY